MKERAIQHAIRVALGLLPDGTLWRNNVGVATHFNPRTHRQEVVRYGLANGSADMVGLVQGRFVSLEIKADDGRLTIDQVRWANVVKSFGGFATTVRSVDEALAAIERARNGARE